MKNKLNITFALLIFSLFVFGQTMLAQKGDSDTTFGTSNTGIYQDLLPLPDEPGDRARYYAVSEVLAARKIIVAGSALLSYINSNGKGICKRIKSGKEKEFICPQTNSLSFPLFIVLCFGS